MIDQVSAVGMDASLNPEAYGYPVGLYKVVLTRPNSLFYSRSQWRSCPSQNWGVLKEAGS